MYRCTLSQLSQHRLVCTIPVRSFVPSRLLSNGAEEGVDIESWISQFSRDSIPKEHLEVSFSRSGGPGGQNVNKVNTKVDMRFTIKTADWLPTAVKAKLREQNPNKINKRMEFVVSSDRHRNQHQNFEDCLNKLHTAIMEAADELVPRETSEETLERIEEFRRIEREKKIKAKERHGQKKASRRKGKEDY